MRAQLIFLICILLAPFFATAQYTEMINTNRPGFSQGAFSVGKNVLQVETGIGFGKEEHDLLQTETDAFLIDYSVRYGLLKEQLEVSLIGTFQSNTVLNNRAAIPFESTFSNFRRNTLGAKYLIYDPYLKRDQKEPNLYSWKANNRIQWADLIPAVAVYAGANFELADNPFTPDSEFSVNPRVAISTQNNFIGHFVLVTNIFADRISTDVPSYGYIITLTHSVTDYFSIFVENQGIKSDFYADQLFRTGAAALINKDLHVDASVLINFKDTPSRLFARVGVAYRFDMHDQDEYIEEKGKAGREARKAEKNAKRDKKKKDKKSKKDKGKDKKVVDDGGALLN